MFFRFFRAVKMSAESKKRKSKCHFENEWLQHKDYKNWIKKVPDKEQKVYCTVCVTAISVADLRISVLDIHAKGKKHLKVQKKPIKVQLASSQKEKESASVNEPMSQSSISSYY